MRNNKSNAGLVAIAFIVLTINALDASAQNAANVRPLQVPQAPSRRFRA